jgi:hypothetical protein
MAVTSSFCPGCQRTVYLGEGATMSCPVCASPLVATEPETGERIVRIANNESLFREVNERIETTVRQNGSAAESATGFVCECGSPDCTETVSVSPRDYEAIRSNPSQFVVLPGHVEEEAERIVRDEGHYLVVEKIGVGRVIAEEKDPRS